MVVYRTAYVVVPSMLGFLFIFWCQLSHVTIATTLLGMALYLWILDIYRPTIPLKGKSVLVTGCDTGFGHALAKHLDSLGCVVFAGCEFSQGDGAQMLQQNSSRNLIILQLDITQEDQVQQAVQRVHSETQALKVEFWCLVNNAGIGMPGEVEFCSMKMYRKVADVNLFGTILVTKSFLPMIRKNRGRVVVVTSIRGRRSQPAGSAYNITKWGLETFSEILRMEMKQWGVSVVIVEPGNYGGATNIFKMEKIRAVYKEMWNGMDPEVRDAYGKDYVNYYVTAREFAAGTACFDLSHVVNDMVRAISDLHPKARYIPGGSNKFFDFGKWMMLIGQYVPTELLDHLTIWRSYTGFPKPKALQKE